MAKFVVLLRGINVGGRIIKMADLKVCFKKMGFKDTQTLLQSGNVIIEGEFNDLTKLKQKIEDSLSETFNYPAKVQVFPLQKIEDVIKNYPFNKEDNNFQHYVIFFGGSLATQLAAEASELDKTTETIEASKGVIYWQVKKGMTLKSAFSKNLTKAKYKQFHTNRNIKTLQKLTTLK